MILICCSGASEVRFYRLADAVLRDSELGRTVSRVDDAGWSVSVCPGDVLIAETRLVADVPDLLDDPYVPDPAT